MCGSLCLQRAASPSLLLFLCVVSRLSDGPIWYLSILALLLIDTPEGAVRAVEMLSFGSFSLAVYKVIKRVVPRHRPFIDCPGVRLYARALDESSFPSGHTMFATGFSTLLCTYVPELAWILWPFTGLVALSRVMLGLHYPSDVAMGMLLGWVFAQAALSMTGIGIGA